MLQGCRLPVFEEAVEGLDGRQADVARHRRVFAVILLEIFQEGADEAGVELLQRQRRWRDLQSLCGEHEEQLEAQGIGVACMRLKPRWRASVSSRNASMRGAIGVMTASLRR